jgi:1-aminocyclopropane-1-carboxylate deaminase/D-cysteine desulfhydrase-like pyridoxal-dependent ACC family enzyme
MPWVPLGDFPTPVEENRLWGRQLGLPSLWLKRDDLSGAAYGGNKIRKLEGLLGLALQRQRRGVFTAGAWGSHHVLATSVYAAQVGLEVGAVLCPQPVTDEVRRNFTATAAQGTTIVAVASPWRVLPRLAWEAWRRRALLIPPGGSALWGTLAYAGAALELANQIAEGRCPQPERLYVALGSGSTLAGLLLGHALQPIAREIIGVRVTDRYMSNELTVAALAAQGARWLQRRSPITFPRHWLRKEIHLIHDQVGEGYGHPTSDGGRAQQMAEREGRLILDPTYTAKTVAGLAADVRRRPPTGPVLYWHTLNSRRLPPPRIVSPDQLPPQVRHLVTPAP